MKKIVIIISALLFSISFCPAQSIQEELERQKKEQQAIEAQKQREVQRQREAEAQRKREIDQQYQNLMATAQKNYEQQWYAQAKQDYLAALELKPEEASNINPKIAAIDNILLELEKQKAEAERERKYKETIASAQRNFDNKQYAQAKHDYRAALEIKPENASFINSKIAEIDKPATLYLYRPRPKGSLSIYPQRYEVFLDNAIAGNTTNNWKTIVTINTFGKKTVMATIEGRRAEVQLDVIPGGSYYIRCGIKSRSVGTGVWKTSTDKNGKTTRYEETKIEYTPILQLVTENVGKSEYNEIVEKTNR